MHIKILYNTDKIKDQLPFIESQKDFLEKNGMFFYFPFDLKKDNFAKQIEEDKKRFEVKHIEEILNKEINKKEALIFKYLKEYNSNIGLFEFVDEYTCFLSFYGCYGYYNFPNEIFVSVCAEPDLIFETIIHELIHLLIYKKTKEKSHQEIESIVDSVFIKSDLKKIFPNYKA